MALIDDFLTNLTSAISATFTSASIVYDIEAEKDDNISWPLFEINFLNKSTHSLAYTEHADYSFQVVYSKETVVDKLSQACISEKFLMDRQLRTALQSLVLSLNYPIKDIQTNYQETLSGVYGSKTISRVSIQFTLSQIKEI